MSTGVQRSMKNADGVTVISNAEIDFEGLGDITIGTSQVAIRSDKSNISSEFRIQADISNTGTIFIGKTGILSDGTNHVIALGAGEEWAFEYNDIANPLYAISDVAAQVINVGVVISI